MYVFYIIRIFDNNYPCVCLFLHSLKFVTSVTDVKPYGQGVKNINLTKMFQLLIDFKKNYFNKITVIESAGGLRPIAGTKCAVHNNFSSFTRKLLISSVHFIVGPKLKILDCWAPWE